MNVTIIPEQVPEEKLAELDAQFFEPGTQFLRRVPADEFRAIHPNVLRTWLHSRAIYGLPTAELIDWLKADIKERWLVKTVEIGAGAGHLGRLLGVKMCDMRMQDHPAIRAYYKASGQPCIKYPDDVKVAPALDFIKHFEPRIVIACWVTQKWYEGDNEGNQYGPDYRDICAQKCVDRIYFIGSDTSHKNYRFGPQGNLTKIRLPFLLSRTNNHADNFVWLWKRRVK